MRGRAMRFLLRQPEDVKRPSLFWRTTAVFVMLSQLLLCDSALAQVTAPSIVAVTVSPAGNACTANMPLKLFIPSGALFSCQSGTYGQVGGSAGGDTITSPNSTLSVGGTATATTLDLNLAKSNIWTAAGALSAPAVLFNGLPITTGGTGTTTWPLVLVQPNGTTTTSWNTAGTMFGINSPSGFAGDIFNIQANGVNVLKESTGGTLTGVSSNFGVYQTATVCASAASPAVCATAASGSVAVPVAGTTLVVNTTRVTANSQIQLAFDSSLGARLSATCNTAINQPSVSARTAGTSFTITMASALSVNPDCISYTIVN